MTGITCPICRQTSLETLICPRCSFDPKPSYNYPPFALPPGTPLQNLYTVIGLLGEPGGFGMVYKVWDSKLLTCLAVKEFFPRQLVGRENDRVNLVPHSPTDAETYRFGLESFIQEARILAHFNHSNLVRVRAVIEQNHTAYMVMDYYEGCTLEEYLKRVDEGRMAPDIAVKVFVRLLDGLRKVHESGFLHRDIKPCNIYLTREGNPILLDFGAARMVVGERSQNLSVILTPGFAPPEQYSRKGKQGTWSDIYAVAATLYKVLTGQTPQESLDRSQVDELQAPARLVPSLSPSLSEAIMRGMSLRPDARWQSVQEFQAALLGSIPGEESKRPDVPHSPLPPTLEMGPKPARPPKKTGRAMKAWIALLVLISLVCVAVGLAGIVQNEKYQQILRAYEQAESQDDLEGMSAARDKLRDHAPSEEALLQEWDAEIAKRTEIQQLENERLALIQGNETRETGEELALNLPGEVPIRFRWIGPGEFYMGSRSDDPWRDSDEVFHRVRLTKGFWIGETEVTQEQYQALMGENPSRHKGDKNPVEAMTWAQAKEFCSRFQNAATSTAWSVYGVRLPSEAEWEYACRAGSHSIFSFSASEALSGYMNSCDLNCSSDSADNDLDDGYAESAPAGEFLPNAWGLHDMHGNVWEWCEDAYYANLSENAVNPLAEDSNGTRTIRGGGWGDKFTSCRAASRLGFGETSSHQAVGFRIVLVPSP